MWQMLLLPVAGLFPAGSRLSISLHQTDSCWAVLNIAKIANRRHATCLFPENAVMAVFPEFVYGAQEKNLYLSFRTANYG